jgi:hypothetical protein
MIAWEGSCYTTYINLLSKKTYINLSKEEKKIIHVILISLMLMSIILCITLYTCILKKKKHIYFNQIFNYNNM